MFTITKVAIPSNLADIYCIQKHTILTVFIDLNIFNTFQNYYNLRKPNLHYESLYARIEIFYFCSLLPTKQTTISNYAEATIKIVPQIKK